MKPQRRRSLESQEARPATEHLPRRREGAGGATRTHDEDAAPTGQQLSPDATRRLLDGDLQPSGLRERRSLLFKPAGLWHVVAD